jgi:Ca-activated chloride channel family protein
LKGFGSLLAKLTSRRVLAVTTLAAALCLGLFIALLDRLHLPDQSLPASVPMAEVVVRTDRPAQDAAPITKILLKERMQETTGHLLLPAAPYSPNTELPQPSAQTEANAETVATADPNPIRKITQEPISTFYIDVDTASYAILGASLMQGPLPTVETVRIEKMVNYFHSAYATPQADALPFEPNITLMQTPWNAYARLVRSGCTAAYQHLPNALR